MSTTLQSPLFGATDFVPPLFALSEVEAPAGSGELSTLVTRQVLSRGAWIDLLPGWLAGTDDLFDQLVREVPWRAERRTMYERVVDVPRLLCFYDESDPLPHPELVRARDALSAHYQPELREPLRTAGLCLYRDGHDSVAWHGDTIGRGRSADTIVAIVSLGSARTLTLRPRGGGPSVRQQLGHGDLLVMGGSCQRTWEHAIPKTTRPVGPGSAFSSARAECGRFGPPNRAEVTSRRTR